MNKIISKVIGCAIVVAVATSPVFSAPLLSLGGVAVGTSNTSSPSTPAASPSTPASSTSTGVPGVAEVTSSGNDTSISVLGGGGSTVDVGAEDPAPLSLRAILPGGSAIGGGAIGGGANGTGNGGSNVASNGGTILGGGPISSGSNGTGNPPVTNSSRLSRLNGILADRDWMALAANNEVCVTGFAVADVNTWLAPRDWDKAREVVAYYGRDIETLQDMLANCSANRQTLGAGSIERVIGIDVLNGKPILYII